MKQKKMKQKKPTARNAETPYTPKPHMLTFPKRRHVETDADRREHARATAEIRRDEAADNDFARLPIEIEERVRRERDAKARLPYLIQTQRNFFITLELIHKFTADEYTKQRIERETKQIKDKWTAAMQTAAPRNFPELADRVAATCRAYQALINEFYTDDPALIKNRIEVVVTDFAGKAEAQMIGLENRSVATANGVDFLVTDRKKKAKNNTLRGKVNQAKGNTEERKRAARDMETALTRVDDRMKNGARYVIVECRKVCNEFKPLTPKKNALGKHEAYAPLTGADGEPIQPDTLAKNYRERFGTKKAKKGKTARTAKPKRRTK